MVEPDGVTDDFRGTSVSAIAEGWLVIGRLCHVRLNLTTPFGVLVSYLGRIVAHKLLERGGPPSRRVLDQATTAGLLPPIPATIRCLARTQFRLPETADDPPIFRLVFRYMFEVGRASRSVRFIHLRNLTRGTTVVGFVWFIALVTLVISGGVSLPW